MKIDSKTSKDDVTGPNNKSPSNASISPFNGAKSVAASEFYNVLADIENLAKDVALLTGDDLTRAGVKINEQIAIARKAAEAMGDALAERTQQTISTTNDFMKRQPWKAIAIGTTIGLILGTMISRR